MLDKKKQQPLYMERTVKHFYEHFTVEQHLFQAYMQQHNPQISGAEQQNMAFLLLCRLMFLYFIQKNGFLDGDIHYLKHHLSRMHRYYGPNTFYQTFLRPLFHQELAEGQLFPRAHFFQGILLHAGANLFKVHDFEHHYHALSIEDAAFLRLFAFFDMYTWSLDEATETRHMGITPRMLGYIFEQYANQQNMGAYYTEEDVTAYIASNTIIPYLFDALGQACPRFFGPQSSIWKLVQEHPDRYIQNALQAREPLTDETTEEHLQRRRFYREVSSRIQAGAIQSIDDFITYNLSLTHFACDTIIALNDASALLCCYQQLTRTTILDPTCGSGEFLLAALHVLFPLYEACLNRLATMHLHETCQQVLRDFRQAYPNQRYGIITTIIMRNLYGIDIMEGAIEICQLRLLLKLLTMVTDPVDIGPFPTIDTNIFVGNALAASDRETGPPRISPTITVATSEIPGIRRRYYAGWSTTFQDILIHGGFNVIIGNPPYVEYIPSAFDYSIEHFTTCTCANLYTCVVERSHQLLSQQGRNGMILPLAAFATKKMQRFLAAFRSWFPGSWLSFYHFRPAMLFSGGKVASIPTAIYLAKAEGPEQRFSTRLLKWTREQRAYLFHNIMYQKVTAPLDPANLHYYPKFGHAYENSILQKILAQHTITHYLTTQSSQNMMYYRTAGGLYWKIFVNFPWPYDTTSNKHCAFKEDYRRDVFVALFNSSLFWWYYTISFDTFNLKDYMLFGFHFTYPEQQEIIEQLCGYCQSLMIDFRLHARHLKRGQTNSYTIYARKSKSIIDAIDRVLAQHYHLSPEELNFILNYDMKYRMGPLLEGGEIV